MRKKKNKKKLIFPLILVAAVGAFFLFKDKEPEEVEKLQTEVIDYRTIANSIAATGTITSSNTKNVSSTLQGMTINKVYVKAGDFINEGDIICEFDVSTIEESINSMKETLETLKEQKKEMENTSTDTDSSTNQLSDLEQQIKEAEKELEELKIDLENKSKELKEYKTTYNNEKTAFETIQKEYNNKQKDYEIAELAKETKNRELKVQEELKNKYFKTINGELVQVDTIGNVIPKENYEFPEYATNLHKTIDEKYNSLFEEYLELSTTANTEKTELDEYKKIYDTALEKFAPIQEKYSSLTIEENSLKSEVSAKESSLEITKATYNTLKSTLDSTSGSLGSLTGSLSGMTGSIDSSIQTLETQIKTYEKQIKNKIVKAPISGLVTSLNVSEGTMYMGTGIATIKGADTFIIQSEIDEYDIPDISVGMDVLIKTDATRDEELKGQVIYVAPSATENSSMASLGIQGSSGKATYKIEIALNENHDRIRLGMNARLSIITVMKDNVLTVPFDAILEDETGAKYVEITNNDVTKEKVYIKTGTEGSYYVEILEGNLEKGMKVVIPESKGTSLEDLIGQMGAVGGLQ